MSAILDALRLKCKGIVSEQVQALCEELDHHFYLRDRAHGDLVARFEKLKEEVDKMKYQGDAA
jgi:hypothetical protein